MSEALFPTMQAYTRKPDVAPDSGAGQGKNRVAGDQEIPFDDLLHGVRSGAARGGIHVAALTEDAPGRVGNPLHQEQQEQLYAPTRAFVEQGKAPWTVIAPTVTPAKESADGAAQAGFRIYARSKDGEAELAKRADGPGNAGTRVDIRR